MKYIILLLSTICMRGVYSQGQWITLGTGGLFANHSYHSLTTNNSGQIFIAYKDNDNNGKTSVMTYTGSTWQFVGSSGFGNSGDFQNIFVSNNGQLYVTYRDAQNTNRVSAMTYTGGTWQFIGTPGFGDINNGLQNIVVNNSGIIYVGYQKDLVNGGLSTRKEKVMVFSGGTWSDFSEFSASSSFGGLRYTAMMPNGNFTVSYSSMAPWYFRYGSNSLGFSSNSLVGNQVFTFTKSGDFFRLNNGNIEKINNGNIINSSDLSGFNTTITYKHLGIKNNGNVFVVYQTSEGTITGNFLIYDAKCFGYTSYMQAPSGTPTICYKKSTPQVFNQNEIVEIPVLYQNTNENTVSNGKINYLGEHSIPSTDGLQTGAINIKVKVFNPTNFEKHMK